MGKTELARTLAEFLFGDEDHLVQVDMSEYMEKHAVSRLVGSPPGYVGYDEGGQLTEVVRRRPYCVVLLDEIEKAHPDVFNILLQILEDGRLTDAQGRTVDFRNAIIIMTSNIGAEMITKDTPLGFAQTANKGMTYEDMKSRVTGELKRVFRPEFLNRVDEVIVFHKLEREEIAPDRRPDDRALQQQLAPQRHHHRAHRRRPRPAGREGLRPHAGRAAAAPRHPALHRGQALRRDARAAVPARARWSSSTPRTTTPCSPSTASASAGSVELPMVGLDEPVAPGRRRLRRSPPAGGDDGPDAGGARGAER